MSTPESRFTTAIAAKSIKETHYHVHHAREWLIRLVDIPYFIHWCAAVWTFPPAVVETLVLPLVDLARGVPVHLPMGAYLWTYASGLVVSAYGVLVRRRWFRVVEREVRIPGLDPGLDGLRVAQLSDLHVGALTPKAWALGWSRAANARKPDLSVVTGDMVTSGTDYHEDIAEALRGVLANVGSILLQDRRTDKFER